MTFPANKRAAPALRAITEPRTAAADLEWAAGPDGKARKLTDAELASIGMPVHDFAPVEESAPRLWDEAFGPDEPEQDGRGVVVVLFLGVAVGIGIAAWLAWKGWVML